AQARAVGGDEASPLQAIMPDRMRAEQAEVFVSQRSFKGDVPSSTIWLDALTPHSLGALIALYEHKVFTQAAIWGINAYDQWGVELGKTMAKQMETSRGASHLPPAGGNA
ncbi:MAG: glucose-6-phosphate isomerase, partial [Hydrogenophaga sp.]|nr:glucose-6-phosphate isomerase [Hydrogenophaga sp.]